VESGQDSIYMIIEAFKTIKTIKVGYLKYLDKTRGRYEGRIFFYRDKKFVDIWLFEKFIEESQNKGSVIDCIFEKMEIQ
jgi:hypothetical protein